MKLTLQGLQGKELWEKAEIALPRYDIAALRERTRKAPLWLHFGAGNIFRGFIAGLQHRLLTDGLSDRGIIAAETFDTEIIDAIYKPFDNLTLSVTLNADATVKREVTASLTEALTAADRERLRAICASPSLQMLSFTITEKGYTLHRSDGTLLPVVEQDMADGPEKARHVMSIVTALLLARFQAGGYPLAVVSMDNCSRNGEKLRAALLEIAESWRVHGYVDEDFLTYLSDGMRVSFPWSMIDKITPRPAPGVEQALTADGVEDMHTVVTAKDTHIAPFVNAERPEYLVIEDDFPGGRPPLERAGVYFCDRETVNKVERMKVTTCLNPLHTAMSTFGCLLGYNLICDEMRDEDIAALVRRLGYAEGLPVVTDPGILSPKDFLDEVVNERLPNPFMPDSPLRITTDTSAKVGIRFGETVKSYLSQGRDLNTLVALPLAIASWLRYLLAVDDKGEPMEVSTDPLKDELQAALGGIVWNRPESYTGQAAGILRNSLIFGLDLLETPLGGRIETMFTQMLGGEGSVRTTLHTYMADDPCQ